MGMADIAEVLWNNFLRHNPNNPHWVNRDRFIISNGHGSMLLYSLLHLTGYQDMTINEIKNFRQLHSKTAGHPEYGLAPGIETTTGPLGQGIANAVGMALAERTLAAQFNRPGFPIVNHYTYVFLGDGCLMEGISHESCSLAGHWGLGKLIAFWDDNGISIDGQVAGWFTDDTPKRFEAYGWHVIPDVDGHDAKAVEQAILEGRKVTDKPTLICSRTTIAYGAPNLSGSEKAHGAALGEAEVALVRKQLAWQYPAFEIPEEYYAAWDARERGGVLEQEWTQLFEHYQAEHPQLAQQFTRRMSRLLPDDFDDYAEEYIRSRQDLDMDIASRKSSLNALNAYGPKLPELMGGSADLTGSNLTQWSGSKTITNHEYGGNYIYYGVREFGMFAIMNGLALHGGFIPYGGTFLVFVDYGRNAVRMAALMKQRVIFVLTHDSIGLGEDGPTHQPVEQIAMLRNTPNLSVWRPCDGVETAVAWRFAIQHEAGPTALLFSRQALPQQHRAMEQLDLVKRGGYVLRDCGVEPEAIIIATGSEVQLALVAQEQLQQQGKRVSVVSMPSTDQFDAQDEAYRESVLPSKVVRRVAVEAAAGNYWHHYVGLTGAIVGLDRFGESAPAKDAFRALGLTAEHVVEKVNSLF